MVSVYNHVFCCHGNRNFGKKIVSETKERDRQQLSKIPEKIAGVRGFSP
jgi:hypothetical protein